MMTHAAIAKRFKAGESVEDIAWSFTDKSDAMKYGDNKKYVQHALRQMMTRQGRHN